MTGPIKISNTLMTFVDEGVPTTNYDAGSSIYVRNHAGRGSYGYAYFTRPFPLGAKIISAKFRMFSYAKATAGSITMYLTMLNQSISYGRVTWNTRPTAMQAIAERTAVKPGTYPDREMFEFDVTAHMQAIAGSEGTGAGAAKWLGWQIRTNWTNVAFDPRFMSPQHPNPDLRPYLEITWSDAPSQPSQLSPAGGRVISAPQPILRFDYVDVSGDTELSLARIQINTIADFTTPLYDSTDTPVDAPQFDLTGSAFTATVGTTYYWRVLVTDGAGLPSIWSAPVSFVYQLLPTVEIQNPPAAPNNFVEEPTPPLTWNMISGTQASYSVDLYRKIGDRWSPIWNRGRTIGATDGLTVPANVITVKDATYLVDLRIWDAHNREAVPNGQVYQLESREFTYEFSALTSPVTNLVSIPRTTVPGIFIEWDRATAPDSYSIIRDGVIIASDLDPDDDTFVDGVHNQWLDRTPVKRVEHVYTVQPVVNGKASSANPTTEATWSMYGTWLLDADGGRTVCLIEDFSRTMAFLEQSEVITPLGAQKSIVITQGMGGYEGAYTGEIWGGLQGGAGATTAVTWKDNLLNLKSYPGQIVYLFLDDMTMPVVLRNVQVVNLAGPDREGYAASFDFYQQSGFAYEIRI